VAYLLPLPARGFFCSAPGLAGAKPRIKEAPLFCVIPLCITAAGCVVLFFFADEIYRLLLPIAGN
jgi:multicomponent Na+:H+ antiporter subunit D